MTIALISAEYPPFNNTGGIATFMAGLARLLTSGGHKVVVFADGGNSLADQTIVGGVTIIPFLNTYNNAYIRTVISFLPCKLIIKILQKRAPAMAQLLRYNVLSLLTFISYKKRAKIHVVHSPVLFALGYLISVIYPKLAIVAHAQGPDELLQPYDIVTWDSRLKARIETSYMKRSMFIIPCSETIRDYLQKKYNFIRKKLMYIPNFVDTRTFPAPKKTINTNSLLFFGRMEKRKGPDLVVGAFAKLAHSDPHIRLILIGEDTNSWLVNGKTISFAQYVKSLKLPRPIQNQITFVPRIDNRPQLLKFLSQNHGIAILPSRYEPFGFVFIEAMMAGSITVASSHGAGAEIIQNGVDGFVVEPVVENIVACIQRIKQLRQQQLLLITRRARTKIRSLYDMSRVRGAYASLYQAIENHHR